jgi:hypothetical protein
MKRILISFIAVMFLFAVRAEPLNILVGDLTFIRPKPWRWAAPPGNSPANSRLLIHNGDKGVVDVRFYAPGKTPLEAQFQWKTFIGPGDTDSYHVEEKKIGKRTITYVSFHGKIKLPNEPALPDQAFLGAVIPYEDKFMHIRMSGPQSLVSAAAVTFKKMLESAVRERDSEVEEK